MQEMKDCWSRFSLSENLESTTKVIVVGLLLSKDRKWGYWWEVTSMKMSSHWLAEMRDIPNFENTSFIVTFWLAYVWDNPAS